MFWGSILLDCQYLYSSEHLLGWVPEEFYMILHHKDKFSSRLRSRGVTALHAGRHSWSELCEAGQEVVTPTKQGS
jgi:hypothetical protein